MPVRFQFVPGREPPDLLDRPWPTPLGEWPEAGFVRLARGLSRHPVRFIRAGAGTYAVKEMPEGEAVHEYRMLRLLVGEGLPAVEAVGLVTGRAEAPDAAHAAALVTRFLDYSLPYRYLFGVEVGQALAPRLIDAAVVLLVRLHLEGFFWGDCSLSNLLFRRDAGALMAYLVDAETVEPHGRLDDGARSHELTIAVENVAGGLLDLQAAGRLPEEIDALEIAAQLEERYHLLWDELTGVVEVDMGERHLIEGRIRRLNELGFDVGEVVVERVDDAARLRVRPALVEEGHHARELLRLTGLTVQENQARRLLNDIAAFGARLSAAEGRPVPAGVAAARWILEVYEPAIGAVPDQLGGRLEPAELFHELLEHRYYLAEAAGAEVGTDEAVRSYVETVLRFRPDERLLGESDA